jgi:hypothetical protein
VANVVLPKVRMFVPCIAVRLQRGKAVTIRSPLHTIRMPSGVTDKYLLDEAWFYTVLTDGVGRFRLSVELRDMDDIILQKSEPQELVFSGGDQLNVKEVGVCMTSVPFPRPGLYEFKLIANHAHLEQGGTAFLRVLPG